MGSITTNTSAGSVPSGSIDHNPGQILRRGVESTSGPDKPALLIGEADLMRGSTRDVDAHAKRHGELPRLRSRAAHGIADRSAPLVSRAH